MTSPQKNKNNQLRIEGKPKKLSWNQITHSANQLAKNSLSIAPTENSIEQKVENKLSSKFTFYQKNIKWRNIAQWVSYFCFGLSLMGATLGLITFIQPNNPMSYFLTVIFLSLLVAVELGFRYFSDKYFDNVFLLRSKINSYLPKFLLMSLISIGVTSGGYYKFNIEHHAPDPALVAIKSEISNKKNQVVIDQKAFDKMLVASTVKRGKDKGRIQYKLESSVDAARKNLETLKTTIATLENKIRGKKVLDVNYQNQVLKESLIGAIALGIFALLYVFCMRYMSYFDNRHYMQTYPTKYLAYLAEITDEKENF